VIAHTSRTIGSIKGLSVFWKLAIGLLAILGCCAAATFTTYLIHAFNTSMGITQSK